MEEEKCIECGTILDANATVCPSCGCPVPAEEPKKAPMATKVEIPSLLFLKQINVLAIISLILGIVIIIMGSKVMNKRTNVSPYVGKSYDASYAAFGGDFYTEIYGATDIIVDELDDVIDGIEVVSNSMNTIANVVYYPIGVLIIAIGMGVCAVSIIHIKKENA